MRRIRKQNIPQGMARLSPVTDTLSGAKARENPAYALVHYKDIVSHVWLPPKVGVAADTIFEEVRNGRPAWGSLVAPYGLGKTATAISLWNYALEKGFVAI